MNHLKLIDHTMSVLREKSAKPRYDNRNLGDFVGWWCDNSMLLRERFVRTGKDDNGDEAHAFARSEYQEQL